VTGRKRSKGEADDSDSLSTLVGEARLSRPQTVKRIWDYVKERDLQDPADKRYIVCEGDDKLKAVFHTDRLHMFT
jgi:upstream activation factor subunit UAF30